MHHLKDVAPSYLSRICTDRHSSRRSLSLVRPDTDVPVSAFGAGYLADCADIPGEPLLMYSLRGVWEPASAVGQNFGRIVLVKAYMHPSAAGVEVTYEGFLFHRDGSWAIGGSWTNEFESTHGRFACQLMPQ